MAQYKTSRELTKAQNFGGEYQKALLMKEKTEQQLRVAIPAEVVEVNYSEMTVSCQPLIREKIKNEYSIEVSVDLPLLVDVPIVMPGSSNYSITFPINKGDEGLVVFSDMCIDSWWQSGGIQDQFETRRHDLSDGFFIPAQMSQPKKYTEVSTTNLEVKNRQSGIGLSISSNNISFKFKDSSNQTISLSIKDIYEFMENHVHDFNYSWTGVPGSSSGTTSKGK